MDIRIVESLPMSGALADPGYKIDGDKESITLDFSYEDSSFDIIDRNINYSLLPYKVGTGGLVKKVFLTYNGISCQTKQVIETVVMESADTADADQNPGYNNSNEWLYLPANFRLPSELQSGASNDLLEWTYPYNEGVTLVKRFLNSESNIDEVLYTAYYRQPTMTFYETANVEGGKVYTDGWYTSYVIAVKTFALLNPDPNIPLSCPVGIIIYNETDEKFYKNITGECLAVDLVNFTHRPENDDTNWVPSPTFADWMELLRNNISSRATNTVGGFGNNNNNPINTTGPSNTATNRFTLSSESVDLTDNSLLINISENPTPVGITLPTDPVYYIETNHLATPELNFAIRNKILEICGCCDDPKFGMPHIESWVRLAQKRLGAFIYFADENFKEAQCVIASSRPHCTQCLYHSKDCNFKYKSSSCS